MTAKTAKKKDAKKEKVASLRSRLDAVLGKGVIVGAEEVDAGYKVRMPSGLPSLDRALAGGWPCGTVVELAGPPSAGKTAVTYATAAALQRRKGKNARILVANVEGVMDKGFARKLGFIVPYSDSDIRMIEHSRGAKLTKDEETELRRAICPVDFVEGAYSANEILDTVIKAAATDEYDLILLDSVAALVADDDLVRQIQGREVEVGCGDERAYGRAINGVVNSFCNRWFLTVRGSKPKGRPNLTVCLLVNQVRANMNTGHGGFDWKVPGAFGLKHAKSASIWVYHGKGLTKGEDGPRVGRMMNWLVDKAKYDIQPGAKGSIPFYFESGFDPVEDLFRTLKAAKLAVHTGGGKWDLIDKFGEVKESYASSVGGEDGVIDLLRTVPEERAKWEEVYVSLFPEKPVLEWVG